MGSKDTVHRKFLIFAPSEGPKLLFQYQFLSIIDNIYKTVSRILFLRKFSNSDYRIPSNKYRGCLLNLGIYLFSLYLTLTFLSLQLKPINVN